MTFLWQRVSTLDITVLKGRVYNKQTRNLHFSYRIYWLDFIPGQSFCTLLVKYKYGSLKLRLKSCLWKAYNSVIVYVYRPVIFTSLFIIQYLSWSDLKPKWKCRKAVCFGIGCQNPCTYCILLCQYKVTYCTSARSCSINILQSLSVPLELTYAGVQVTKHLCFVEEVHWERSRGHSGQGLLAYVSHFGGIIWLFTIYKFIKIE